MNVSLDGVGLLGVARQLIDPALVARRRRIERQAATVELSQHLVHALFAHAETLGQTLLRRRPVARRRLRPEPRALAAQAKEHARVERAARARHQAPRIHDAHHDLRTHPVRCVGGETHVTLGVEAIERLHQPDVAFADQVGDGDAVVLVFECGEDDVSQVGLDQALSGTTVARALPGSNARELRLW